MNIAGEGIATLRTWSTVARGAIGLFLFVLTLLILANGLLLWRELTTEMGMGIGAYNPVLALTLGATNALLGLFLLIATVPVMGWIYRAHANLREAGLDELRYSPGWSVGSFFVPLLNLVVPFRAMRELHNRSHGEGPWQAATAVGDVTSWWACLISATMVSTVAAMVALIATLPNFYVLQPPGVNTGLALFSLVLFFGAGAFLFRTIGAVSRAQAQMLHLNPTDVFG
jgi:hypothetical protein